MSVRRVLICTTRSDALGGAQIHIRDLAVTLQRRGLDVCVVAGGMPQNVFFRLLDTAGVPWRLLKHSVQRLSPVRDYLTVRELRRAVREFAPDVLHAHSAKAGAISRIVGVAGRIPVVYTVHGWPFSVGLPIMHRLGFGALEWLLGRLPGEVVAVSEFDAGLARHYGVVPDDRLTVIRNARPQMFQEQTGSASPPDGALRLVSTTRFDPPKDPLSLIRAIALLPPSIDVFLTFLGGGSQLPAARREARRVGVADRVNFLGEVTQRQVHAELGNAHAFVLSSRKEGLPLSIVEAQAVGLPVVASDVGGVSELVECGESGLLVPSGSAEALARAISRLNDPETWHKLATGSQLASAKLPSIEDVADSLVSIYEKAVV